MAIVLIALSISGCETSGSDSPTPAVASSSVVAVPAGLEAPDQTIEPGRQRVTFDPCLDIDEATYRKVGFDPATRKRQDRFTETAVLGCTVDGPDRWATLMAANADFDGQWRAAQHRATMTKVNGRDAYIGLNAVNDNGCTLVMRTSFGMMIVDTDDLVPRHKVPLPPACDGVPEIGSAIEPLISKEK